MLLALDTSTRLASIALYDRERGLLAERTWQSSNRHTVELMPQVEQMLSQAGAMTAELRAVAVALGPGSFTGLRVALAAGKGLALSLSVPLIGVPTLDAVAYPLSYQDLPVVAIVQAGRGRVCWALYGYGPGGWSVQSPYRLTTVVALAGEIRPPVLFTGEMLPVTRATLVDSLGEKARCLPPALATRRAGCLAELAWRRFARGEHDDVVSLTPIYLHEPAAPVAGRER